MKELCRLYFTLATISLAFEGPVAIEEVEYKTWIPNTNWNNGANWASGKAPCSLNSVQLSVPLSSAPLAVGLTGHNSLQSLTLPTSGELIFYKTSGLTFFQDKDIVLDNCTEKGGIQFVASAPKVWYNPNNWQVTDVDGNPVSNQANAVLHMEKVPCQHDQVMFPKESSFNVGSTKPVVIASLTISGQQYSQSSFKDFMNSESGAMQFKLNQVPVQLTGKTCSDAKGCVCNTFQERMTICNHVICVQPQCSDPLKPVGSCCTYCGALIKVKVGASFTLNGFKTKIMNLSAKLANGSALVQVSISRVGDTIQVVFTDSAKGEYAQRLAEQITDQLSGSSDFTIIKISQSRPASRSADAKKDDTSSLALSLGLGIGIGGLLLLISIILAFLWKRKKRNRSLSLPEEDQNDIELEEVADNAAGEDDEGHPSTGTKYQKLESYNLSYKGRAKTTFTNPLYESTSSENLTPVI